jgi:hypothetical protein
MQIITLAFLFIAAIILAVTWWKSYRDMMYVEQIVSEAREKGHTVRIGCIEKGVMLNEEVL